MNNEQIMSTGEVINTLFQLFNQGAECVILYNIVNIPYYCFPDITVNTLMRICDGQKITKVTIYENE
jgi:hypothetical protein